MSKPGPKERYRKEFCEMANRFALLGMTHKEMAECFEIRESTFYNWFNKYPEFKEAIKQGGREANSRVAASLYKRAIEGDNTAAIFFLKNRERDKWADRIVNEHKQEKPFEMKITIEGPKQQAEGALIDVTPTLAIDCEPERAPD